MWQKKRSLRRRREPNRRHGLNGRLRKKTINTRRREYGEAARTAEERQREPTGLPLLYKAPESTRSREADPRPVAEGSTPGRAGTRKKAKGGNFKGKKSRSGRNMQKTHRTGSPVALATEGRGECRGNPNPERARERERKQSPL